MTSPHEPAPTIADPTELLLGHLDFYRGVVRRKVEGLDEHDLRTTRVPSGWTPIELLQHLAYMERRWLQWGFAAQPVLNPYGDENADERWHVEADRDLSAVLALLDDAAAHTRVIATAADLSDRARFGGRFSGGDTAPTLMWILLHVLQEYARHAGQLDIARELVDGATGE
jgi:uncharacterized damage-inducible protein DinB